VTAGETAFHNEPFVYMHDSTPDFMSLFEGYSKAHGIYQLTGELEPNGKRKGRAATISRQVTMELWDAHLCGEQGLGIIPINENSEVRFAAIDIDSYPLNHRELVEKLAAIQWPCFVCETKSHGAHIYIFFKEWISASTVVNRLRTLAAYLGYGGSEIFPRQSRIIEARGDVGQWINMPYFGGSRQAWNKQTISITSFTSKALESRLTKKEFEELTLPIVDKLPDGPPCLQLLCTNGFPPGTRNNGLFNLGVYARKSNPDGWKKDIEDFNTRFMDPPLPSQEVLGVIKSIGKKEFQYLCKQQPIIQYCDLDKCRTCRFGVGGHDLGMPHFGTLTKICTDPPVWFLEVEGGGRLELSTEDLQSPLHFQKACMMALNVMPSIPKRTEWEDIVRRLLVTCTMIEVPKEATSKGQLKDHLEEFCTSRVQGRSHEDLLLGKPVLHNGRHYFRMKDFLAYLDRVKFRVLQTNAIAVYLRDAGADKHFFNLCGKGCNCYSIPEFKSQTRSLDIPQQIRPPMI
jgi:hypothetical protein